MWTHDRTCSYRQELYNGVDITLGLIIKSRALPRHNQMREFLLTLLLLAVAITGFALGSLGKNYKRRRRFTSDLYFPYKWHWLSWAYWATLFTLICAQLLSDKQIAAVVILGIYTLWLWSNAIRLLMAWHRNIDIEIG